MNRKQLTILLVLLVVLGGAGLLLRRHKEASWTSGSPGAGKKLLGEFPVNDVAQITIKQGAAQVNLVKKDDLWRLRERSDYPANFSQISEVLLKLRDLKVVQTESVGASQLPRLSLVPGDATNSAVVVEFKDAAGKTVRTLLLGKKHTRKAKGPPSPYGDMGEDGWPDGRYVKAGADAAEVALVSDALANIEPKPESWLNKDFFKVEKTKSIAVAYPGEKATNSWKVTRDTETASDWKLADAKPGETLDTAKTSGFSYALNGPNFNDVLPGDTAPAQTGLDKPTVITLETFDNLTYTLKVGAKTNDSLPMTVSVAADLPKERPPVKDEKPEDKEKADKAFKEQQKKVEEKLAQEKACEKWVYLVQNWALDSILKDRSQLMAEKKEEKKDEKPAGAPGAPAPPMPDPSAILPDAPPATNGPGK
jgi:hypothetical protein